MTNKNIIILIIILVILAVGSFFLIRSNQVKNQEKINDDSQLLGADRDEHGCIPSAGYSWCEIKNKCLRIWEEECVDVTLGDQKVFCERDNGVWYSDDNTCEKNSLTKEECLAQDGVFVECASACRHNPKAEICTAQCVQTCTVPVVIGK